RWSRITIDVSYLFLRDDPWDRLNQLRKKMPNVLFQVLLRAGNAVGYKNYPDNVIEKVVKESSEARIDVFRIFDSLNWLEGIKPASEAVRNNNKVDEASICFTGNNLNTGINKYDSDDYVN